MAETKEVKGTQWLADFANAKLGRDDITNGKVRITLRHLVKQRILDRDKGRYSFSGPKDPQVIEVLKAFKSGNTGSAEKLDELKAKRTAKKSPAKPVVEDEEQEEAPARKARSRSRKAAEPAPAKRSRTRKAEPVEEEDEDIDIDDI